MARVIQGRLQKLAEDTLPESQCGFRKYRHGILSEAANREVVGA